MLNITVDWTWTWWVVLVMIVDITIRVLAVIVIPRNRRPTAAMAWLLPLPPAAVAKAVPSSVSPGAGNLDTDVVRSMLILPTTTIRGVLIPRGYRPSFSFDEPCG